MTKKHFIELAKLLKDQNFKMSVALDSPEGGYNAIVRELANFCAAQNKNFDRQRWLSYIAGDCGPNGGRIRHNENRNSNKARKPRLAEAKG